MKSWHILVSVFAIFLFVILFWGNALAKIAWGGRYSDLALILDRSDAVLAMEIGNYYFNGQGGYDIKKAETGFGRAVAIDQKISLGHYQLARVYFVEGKNAKALSEVNKELELYANHFRAYYMRGLIYGASGKYPEAEEDFTYFTSIAQGEWAGYNDLAWILLKEGKNDEAIRTIRNAFGYVRNGAENAWLENDLGVAYLNLKNYNEAAHAFKKAIAITEKMTLEDWLRAYPGNNPKSAADGFLAFQEALQKNLKSAQSVDNSP